MGLASSPSVRSTCVGMKTGRICSDKEEEEGSFWELRVSEDDEAGRRMEAVTEDETGDLMRSTSGIGVLLVFEMMESIQVSEPASQDFECCEEA